mmetsp:Transcript_32061/g.60376  ORF Transcript_32061/g.60376 Transcript_32061/m.60376 type:complete len:471 (+) Transcript_32061:48-1460(+)
MSPSVQSIASSVRCVCIGLFLQFCLHLGETQCDGFRTQCREVLEALQGVTACPTIHWGGANMVVMCEATSGRQVVRMSMLANVDKNAQYIVSLQNMLSMFARDQKAHPIQELFLESAKVLTKSGVELRRLVRESEYDGEAKWRDAFQLSRLVFPPAIPAAACKLCVPLASPVDIFGQFGHVVASMREIIIGVSVMKEVAGSVEDMLPSLSALDLVTLLVAYHCDLKLMAKCGHLHDAHSGNLLVINGGGDDFDFRWHDFGESFDVADHSQQRRRELRDHVQTFTKKVVTAINLTAPGLANEVTGTHFSCFEMFTLNIGYMLQCMGERALELATTVVQSHALDTMQKRKFLEKVSRGFAESDMNSLWRDYFSLGTTASSMTWVRQLLKLDKEKDGYEITDSQAFPITESVANVALLKKAIKQEEELKFPASQILIYSRDKDGKWKQEETMSASLRPTSKSDCYGFVLPDIS